MAKRTLHLHLTIITNLQIIANITILITMLYETLERAHLERA